jgi:uncharacterized protein YcbK (DUF882 family)
MSMQLLAASVLLLSFASSRAHADREHTVSRGQTLVRIAARYDVEVTSLAVANGLTRSSPLRAGQVLVVPSRGVVYVGSGETLGGIAKRHGVSQAELARANQLPDGAELRAGQRLQLPGFEAAQEQEVAEKRWGIPRTRGMVTFHRLATNVTRRIRVIDTRGRLRPDALRQLARLLKPRDSRRTKEPHARLVRLIAKVSDHFGGRPIHVVSGYRKAAGYTRNTSRHVAGQAIDFRIPGVPLPMLREYCEHQDHVGVGYYPKSNFVHLDVRRTAARWTDLSGPGEAPQFVKGPFNDQAAVVENPDAAATGDEAEPEAEDDGQPPVEDAADAPAP